MYSKRNPSRSRGSSSMALVLLLIVGLIIGSGGVYFIIYQPEINNNENKISDLTSEVSDLTVTISNLESEVTELESVNSDYESQVSQLKSDLSDAEGEIDTLESRILTIQNSARDDLDQIQSQYDDLESSYEDLLNAYELLVAALPLSPVPISAETINLEFSWWYQGYPWTLSLSIPQSMLEYYQSMDRAPTQDYSVYVTHPYDDVYINTIIQKFNFIAIERSFTEIEKINLIISFVQSLPYTSDSVTTSFDDYPRYPLETLVDEGGDCEDTSILAAALLDALNYDVVLVAPPGHMAVGVDIDTYGSYYEYEGESYFFLETTGEGWEIGELPENYEGVSVYVYPLNPIPVIIHDWTGTYSGSKLTLNIEIENIGTAMAEDIRAYAAFDSVSNYVWNPEESNPFDLNIGGKVSIQLVLDVPSNKYTRIMVGILDSEGYLIDVSYSKWFDS